MNNPNIKIYLAISGVLIVLFILILIIPFSKKSTNNALRTTNQYLIPTTVKTNTSTASEQANNQLQNSVTPSPISVPADFTGAAEEELPTQELETAFQKKELRQKTPLSLSTFTVDFDYGEDKFTVALNDPKDLSQKEFESWRTNNYPRLSAEQFLLK